MTVIFIPNNREENDLNKFPKAKDINIIRTLFKIMAEDGQYTFDLDKTNLLSENLFPEKLHKNLNVFMKIFCVFKFSGKEPEIYKQYCKDYRKQISNAKIKLDSAKKTTDKQKIEEAQYNYVQIERDYNKNKRLV